MNIYIYSDESGVFDYKHNDYFLFGGLIFFDKESKDICSRKYSHIEKVLRDSGKYSSLDELKASRLSNKDKGKIFRSLNHYFKFCVLIKEKNINKNIFENKGHKQRFLDYAYKIVLKKLFEYLLNKKFINPHQVQYIYVNVDEHTTATDSKKELKTNLLNEFKFGTFNIQYDKFFDPIFPTMNDVQVNFCDSKKNLLIRAADIVANHFYHSAIINEGNIKTGQNTFVFVVPEYKIFGNTLDLEDKN